MNDANNKTPQNVESFNPDLKSVLGEIEEGHYLIIVADRKRAVLLLFNKGTLEVHKDIMDPSVQKSTKIDSGDLYGRNTKLSHKIDNEIHRHMQLIVQEVDKLIKGKSINGVFIGGHKPLLHIIKEELPMELQKKLRGDFITELNTSEAKLINHCKLILKEYIK
jgi:hypothetical protein